MTASSGEVSGLIIKIEDSNPDKLVLIPLDGLSSVQDGDDWLLETMMTRDELMALPSIR